MKNTEAYTIIYQVCDKVSCDGPARRAINDALETIQKSLEEFDKQNNPMKNIS